MIPSNALRPKAFLTLRHFPSWSRATNRCLHYDGRNRLSNFWTPTQRAQTDDEDTNTGHDLLLRAGYLRQAHSGIFHLLPLGLRVQDKVEHLIDKHMRSIGASKVSLSSLSSEDLWQRSGRLDKGRSSELLRLQDRKGAKYLLSPTHEEEITTIIANAVHSYKELPLRLYQVSRKYRDEPRPRQGLLRGREFVMKDLYTFDTDSEAAHQTYSEVRRAYDAFFKALRIPFLTARADSGNMGGTLSHEYHFASPNGEDTIIQCDNCNFSINEELYVERHNGDSIDSEVSDSLQEVEHYVSKDRSALCTIYYPPFAGEPNVYAVKAIFPDLDTSLQGPQAKAAHTGSQHLIYADPRLGPSTYLTPTQHGEPINLTKALSSSRCPSCTAGHLTLHQAVELGHTFHLSTRYSLPLNANILDAKNNTVPIEMGCHGIGVSRLIGACASLLADVKGLNWPLSIAPFEVLLIPGSGLSKEGGEVERVYDALNSSFSPAAVPEGELRRGWDVAIDDRERQLGWKLKDADLVGYPFIVVMGRAWKERGEVEVQCRRLGVKREVEVDGLGEVLREMAEKL